MYGNQLKFTLTPIPFRKHASFSWFSYLAANVKDQQPLISCPNVGNHFRID